MGSYIIDLYHRATTHQTLTVRERAAIKAVQGVILGVLVAIGPQLIDLVSGKSTLAVSTVIIDAIIGAALTGAIKLWSAQGPEEAAIGQVIEAYANAKLEADAPGSVAMAQNWQAIQFTVPIQKRPVNVVPTNIPVAPPRMSQQWTPTPQYGSMSMPPDAGNAQTSTALTPQIINSVTTDKTPSVQLPTLPPAPEAVTYPTYEAPPAPAQHISETSTGIIPAVNFYPPAPQP